MRPLGGRPGVNKVDRATRARTLTFVSTQEYAMYRTDHPAFVVDYAF